ncbi:hypothetical protein HRI_004553700 [Hibiscus trionum]|uniref:Endonuclease/exonuclease/phosphatase domain-containing protein n=1 Tax=Hibiscus trionum TaxID=183268 RepID=A0A9W7MRI8_HIBTR|nr:hypothetical protein HRI_004553700 [Hibiscus trionum]
MRWEEKVSWNIRGLGRPEKVKEVRNVIFESKCKICLLQETKLVNIKLWLEKQLKGSSFRGMVVSPSVEASRGLISLWDSNFLMIESTVITSRFIAMVGSLGSGNKKCGIINIYASNDSCERRSFFEEVSLFIANLNLPVIVGGDFNDVMCADERIEASTGSKSGLLLGNFILKNNLLDLPLQGERFTWFRGGTSIAASRLDIIILSPEVFSWFSSMHQRTLPRSLSDH